MSRIFACTIATALLAAGTPAAQDAARLPAGAPGTVTLTRTDYDQLLDLASARTWRRWRRR